jgi:hypothetical protein
METISRVYRGYVIENITDEPEAVVILHRLSIIDRADNWQAARKLIDEWMDAK